MMGSKRHAVGILVLAAMLGAMAGAAWADVREEGLAVRFERLQAIAPGEQPPRWAGLDPHERQQMRQQMREQWRQSPPEGRRRDDERERWQQMPSEDRNRLRNEMREQRELGGRRHDRRH